MKNILALAWLCVGILATGWAQQSEPRPLRVMTSFYPMYAMTLNVAADVPGVKVDCLSEPFMGCLHDYQLNPKDMKRLAGADVLVVNGAGMEGYLDKVLKAFPELKVIDASRGIKLQDNGNAHVWVGVSGAIRQVENIAKGLAKADPSRAEAFRQNAEAYIEKLKALRAEMREKLREFKGREMITFHEAFPYFAAEFGLKVAGVIEREPGSEPTPGELRQTIELVRSRGVKALFAEPQYSPKSAEVIARETGAKVRILDPVVTGPREPAKARNVYIETMRNNAQALADAFRG